ncbi:MAG: hypothetical protein Q4A34_01365 [Candidatus Saccharibacteria bacterium]|nr:hypothetical protein [Candidatus Saccharibacteria bacterium]
MDPTTQPPVQPVAPQPAMPQPPIMNVVQPPKKKKTGLIVGIIAGSVALVAIIVTVVLVLALGNDPQKLVADAMANFVDAKQVRITGKAVTDADGAKMTATLKVDVHDGSGKAEIDMKIENKAMPVPIEFKLSGILMKDKTMFVKLDKLEELVNTFVDMMASSLGGGQTLTLEQKQAMRMALFAQMKQSGFDIENVIETIDGKWMRISESAMKEMMGDKKDSKCSLNKLMELNTAANQKELADALRKQPLMLKKDVKIEDRNGGRGFEFDLTAVKSADSPVKNTAFGRFMDECADESSTSSSGDLETVRIWVNPSTRQVTAMETKTNKVTAQHEVTVGQSDSITEPSDARDIEGVMRDLDLPTDGDSPRLPFGRNGLGIFSA